MTLSKYNHEMNQDICVVVAEEKYLNEMVQCHIKAFPGEFITLVGTRFIKGFYKFYVLHKDGIVFVALESAGKVVGLVAGGMPELGKQFIFRRVPFYILDMVFSAIINTYVRRRLVMHLCKAIERILTKLGFRIDNAVKDAPPEEPSGTWSNLLSICVSPGFHGQGIGSRLMEAFGAKSKARGYKTMRLSVNSDNDAAIALYKKCGWEVILENPIGVYFKRDVAE